MFLWPVTVCLCLCLFVSSAGVRVSSVWIPKGGNSRKVPRRSSEDSSDDELSALHETFQITWAQIKHHAWRLSSSVVLAVVWRGEGGGGVFWIQTPQFGRSRWSLDGFVWSDLWHKNLLQGSIMFCCMKTKTSYDWVRQTSRKSFSQHGVTHIFLVSSGKFKFVKKKKKKIDGSSNRTMRRHSRRWWVEEEASWRLGSEKSKLGSPGFFSVTLSFEWCDSSLSFLHSGPEHDSGTWTSLSVWNVSLCSSVYVLSLLLLLLLLLLLSGLVVNKCSIIKSWFVVSTHSDLVKTLVHLQLLGPTHTCAKTKHSFRLNLAIINN